MAQDVAQRLPVFATALEQAEQLMRAAEALAPLARPLPLFLLAEPGGSAIAARLPDNWQLNAHGLTVPDMPGTPLLEREVRPAPRPANSFSRVDRAGQ